MKKFSIHPISIIVWVWLFLVTGVVVASNYLLAIFLHEMGHYLVAKKLGYKLSKFSLSPYGAQLNYKNQNFQSQDEIKIALAGPMANLISIFLIFSIWWIAPTTYFFTSSFVEISLIIALFNLLPAYPLDGGRVFVCLSSMIFEKKTAKKITVVFNVLLSILFFALFCFCAFVDFNPSLLLFSVFLVVGILDFNFVSKYERINIFCKTNKNFIKPNLCIVSSNTTLKELLRKVQTSKTFVFCLILDNGRIIFLSEKLLMKMSLNFSLDTQIGELLVNKNF